METKQQPEPLRLFDNFERGDSSPSRHPESLFAFFNRSAWARSENIRQALEQWFSRYPIEHQKDLRGRFRSKHAFPFYTATFELVLHELLRSQGAVTVHPDATWGTSSRIDFLVEPLGGQPYLIEAVTLFGESEAEHKAGLVVDSLCDAVNQVDCPDYWLHVSIEGTAAQQPSSRKLKEFLTGKLQSLKPDQACGDAAVLLDDEWVYSADGLTLTFSRTPKSPDMRGKPGLPSLGSCSPACKWSTAVEDVREQLRMKARSYGAPPLPLVIALNVLDWTYLGAEEVVQALFGTVRESIKVMWPSDNPQEVHVADSKLVQERDGLLFDGEMPHYRVVSGVLVFDALSASSLGAVSSLLLLNPFANHALAGDPSGFARATFSGGQWMYQPGKSVRELLGLPEDWPGAQPE